MAAGRTVCQRRAVVRAPADLPPERDPDPHAEYDGLNGKVRWQEYHQAGPNVSVDLTKVFTPTERVCAYALCYVSSPVEQPAQLRFASNDAGKLWLGGRLVHDYPREGTAELDRDIVPIRLPKGTTPILLKITNNRLNWGFVLRLTDGQGRALKNVKFSLSPGEKPSPSGRLAPLGTLNHPLSPRPVVINSCRDVEEPFKRR